jgi:acyl CoA:acetate/3-ketoacid CoA transferase beta subunit
MTTGTASEPLPSTAEATLDELISVCISRQVVDGELLAQGINTPLVMAGYILARLTHAPKVQFASAIGQAIGVEWAPLSVARAEDHWLTKGLIHVSFAEAALDLLPGFHPKEFFRPAQVDQAGNFNNIAFGRDYRRPRMRLPGSGGIPDVTPFSDRIYLYVPRHSKLTFVEKVDFVSGLGHSPERKAGTGPRYLVSDLGQFDWADGVMRLTSLHPGVSVEDVRRKTGFDLQIPTTPATTPEPSCDELRLLREVIDPLGVRRLEMLGGSARKEHLRWILEQENAL